MGTICARLLENQPDLRIREQGLTGLKMAEWLFMHDLIPSEDLSSKLDLLSYRTYRKNINRPECYSFSVRAYFILKVTQFLKRTSFKEVINDDLVMGIAAVGEICITVMYLENHLIDGKFGVVDSESKKRTEKQKKDLSATLYHFIGEYFDREVASIISENVFELFRQYHYGNKLDKDHLGISSIKNGKKGMSILPNDLRESTLPEELFSLIKNPIDPVLEILPEQISEERNFDLTKKRRKREERLQPFVNKDFLEQYLFRSHLINAIFFERFAEILLKVFCQKNTSFRDSIKYFSRGFGLIQQLVNDISDFTVPHSLSTKLPSDQQSDFRRGIVTLPLLIYYERFTGNEEYPHLINYLDKCRSDPDLSYPGEKLILCEMEGVDLPKRKRRKNSPIGLSQGYVRNIAMNMYANLEELNSSVEGKDLLSLLQVCVKNRFFGEYFKS